MLAVPMLASCDTSALVSASTPLVSASCFALQVAALLTLIFYPEYVKVPVYAAGVAAVYAIIDYGMAGVRKMAPA